MKFSDLLILGGAGAIIYFFLKKNKKGEVKANNNSIKQTPLTEDMNPYLVENTTMRPQLFSDNLVSSFNTNQYATIAPSTLHIYKIKENDL
jgi:hypothetical protein